MPLKFKGILLALLTTRKERILVLSRTSLASLKPVRVIMFTSCSLKVITTKVTAKKFTKSILKEGLCSLSKTKLRLLRERVASPMALNLTWELTWTKLKFHTLLVAPKLLKLSNQHRRLVRMFLMAFSEKQLAELREDKPQSVNSLTIDQTVTMESKIIKSLPSKSTRRSMHALKKGSKLMLMAPVITPPP